MALKSKQKKEHTDKTVLFLYQYNLRKLKIALEKNCISKKQFNLISTELETQLDKGVQSSFEDIFDSFPSLLPLQEILPILNKELFKYNQIIIKLAQQFAKNTINQQLKLQKEDSVSIEQANKRLNNTFLEILKNLTNDYIASNQRNIDDILLESGFIQKSQLEFLHDSATHLEIKTKDRKFGEIAVKNEFTTQEIVNSALVEQTERYRKTSKNYIIGDILVERNHITPEIRDEILIIQNRVLEEDWEDTLKKVGESSIKEKEKNALFGAMILKERLLDEKQVVEALKIQARELEEYRKKKKDEESHPDNITIESEDTQNLKPRWIGDILVENFGLSERDRQRIVKKQMAFNIERINLKLGMNLSNAHIELFNEMEQYFNLSYSKDNIEAYIEVLKPIPGTMTKDNMIIWLYHKKIRYGRINNAITSLVTGKVGPGKKILLAKGDEPKLAQIKYKFHFDTQQAEKYVQTNNYENISKLVVSKGAKLITFEKDKGKSGLNVNHCFVAPPMITSIPIIKGKNVIRNENEFIASCDGIPHFSNKKVLSVSFRIHLNGDIFPENLSMNSSTGFDCDFDIQGSIQSGVVMECRKLKVSNIMGKIRTTDEVTVLHETLNGEVVSKGNIYLASVENSTVTGGKSIIIQPNSNNSDSGCTSYFVFLVFEGISATSQSTSLGISTDCPILVSSG
ncbi:MAG: hypothetical protein HQK67_10315, partial [Desulfamplus sp.]|nr:hypothetical protein [Desulfamplus sp.]